MPCKTKTVGEAQALCDSPNLCANHLYDADGIAARELVARLPAKDAAVVQKMLERIEGYESGAESFAKIYIAEQKQTAALVAALETWREAFDAYLDNDDATADDIVGPCSALLSAAESYEAPEAMHDNAKDCAAMILDGGW